MIIKIAKIYSDFQGLPGQQVSLLQSLSHFISTFIGPLHSSRQLTVVSIHRLSPKAFSVFLAYYLAPQRMISASGTRGVRDISLGHLLSRISGREEDWQNK